jgi:hypothetical protein
MSLHKRNRAGLLFGSVKFASYRLSFLQQDLLEAHRRNTSCKACCQFSFGPAGEADHIFVANRLYRPFEIGHRQSWKSRYWLVASGRVDWQNRLNCVS